MDRADEQRKGRLLKQAERLIDELMEWSDSTPEPSLSQIEGVVLMLRQRFSEEMGREVIEAQEAKQPVPGPMCRKCGQEMRYKGQKEIEPRTWMGDVKITRGYYHCAVCQEGLFPPG